jgi:hypothetical protein
MRLRRIAAGAYLAQADSHAPAWHIQHDGAGLRDGGAWVVYPDRCWDTHGAAGVFDDLSSASTFALRMSADALQWLVDCAF